MYVFGMTDHTVDTERRSGMEVFLRILFVFNLKIKNGGPGNLPKSVFAIAVEGGPRK
jgi:hypothetical protein